MARSYLHKHLSQIRLLSPFELDNSFKVAFDDIYHSGYLSSIGLQASLMIHSFPQLLHQNSHFFGSFSCDEKAYISINARSVHKDKDVEIIRVQLTEKENPIYLGFMTFGKNAQHKHTAFPMADPGNPAAILQTPLAKFNENKIDIQVQLDESCSSFEYQPKNFLSLSGSFKFDRKVSLTPCDLQLLADLIPTSKFFHAKKKKKWIPTFKMDTQFYSSAELKPTKSLCFKINTQATHQNLLEDSITLYDISGVVYLENKRLCYYK